MKLIIPKMKETFGNLEYAGMGESIYEYINKRRQETYRVYNLYSSVQRADNVSVRIPATVRMKNFDYEEEISLLNPRITVKAYSVGDRSYVDYLLYADDIVSIGSEVVE